MKTVIELLAEAKRCECQWVLAVQDNEVNKYHV